jgi:hypothetical protein
MRAAVLYIEGVERLNIRTAPPRMPCRSGFLPQTATSSRFDPSRLAAVHRAAEVSNEHSTALQVQSRADTFHKMGEDDPRLLARLS